MTAPVPPTAWTVTCLGTRVFRGQRERDRLMAICTTLERAREIILGNANDIHETTFDHAVIEHVGLDGAYPELGGTEPSEWYEWHEVKAFLAEDGQKVKEWLDGEIVKAEAAKKPGLRVVK